MEFLINTPHFRKPIFSDPPILHKNTKTKDMELFIKDRLFFSRLLPECKSFLEFNLKKNLLQKLNITEEDKAKYEIVQDETTGTIRWNPKTDAENPLQVELSADELALIKRGIESLDGQPLPDELWMTAERIWNAATNK